VDGAVALETGTVAIVVAAGAGGMVAPAAYEAAVPTTRAAEAVVPAVTVWKMT
jgi:hypothetical protein